MQHCGSGLVLREMRKSREELIAELEMRNLIRREAYRVRRAFQVEETEDEGSNYSYDALKQERLKSVREVG